MARRSSGSGGKGTCDITKCDKDAERSVSAKKVLGAGMKTDVERGNAHLCKEHYKKFKKKTREERKLERMGW